VAALLLGQLDDVGVLVLALQAFWRLCPSAVVAFHRIAVAEGRGYSAMSTADDVIDVEWKRV
jgi:hypothetical protein